MSIRAVTKVARLLPEYLLPTSRQGIGHGCERGVGHAQRSGGFLRLERCRHERSNRIVLRVELARNRRIAAILFAAADAKCHQRDHQCRAGAHAPWPSPRPPLGAAIHERERGEEYGDDRGDDKDTDHGAVPRPVLEPLEIGT